MRPRRPLLEGVRQELRGGALVGVSRAAAPGRPALLPGRPGQASAEDSALAGEKGKL